ncbi:MAG: hypothetical protein ACREB2_14640 [Pseudolabrys sp.]
MKNYIAILLFLAFAAAAQAKPAPVDPQLVAFSPGDLAISIAPAAAILERQYFQAPQPANTASRIFPCRLQLRVFDKTRLAQSCH